MALRPSCDTGTYLMTASLFWRVERQVFWQEGTRSDQRHIPFEDIPKLGKFVDGCGADETSYFCQSLGIRQEFPLGVAFVGHGLELDDLEDLSVLAGTFLKEEGTSSFVGEMKPGGHGCQGDGQDEKCRAGGSYVYGSLEEVAVWFHMSCLLRGLTQSPQRRWERRGNF